MEGTYFIAGLFFNYVWHVHDHYIVPYSQHGGIEYKHYIIHAREVRILKAIKLTSGAKYFVKYTSNYNNKQTGYPSR